MSNLAVHKITTGIEGVNVLTFLNVPEKGDEWNETSKQCWHDARSPAL